MRTQLASLTESGMTIILGRICISPTEAIRQGGGPYMQQLEFCELRVIIHEPEHALHDPEIATEDRKSGTGTLILSPVRRAKIADH